MKPPKSIKFKTVQKEQNSGIFFHDLKQESDGEDENEQKEDAVEVWLVLRSRDRGP